VSAAPSGAFFSSCSDIQQRFVFRSWQGFQEFPAEAYFTMNCLSIPYLLLVFPQKGLQN
jgi:hypothetical protein